MAIPIYTVLRYCDYHNLLLFIHKQEASVIRGGYGDVVTHVVTMPNFSELMALATPPIATLSWYALVGSKVKAGDHIFIT